MAPNWLFVFYSWQIARTDVERLEKGKYIYPYAVGILSPACNYVSFSRIYTAKCIFFQESVYSRSLDHWGIKCLMETCDDLCLIPSPYSTDIFDWPPLIDKIMDVVFLNIFFQIADYFVGIGKACRKLVAADVGYLNGLYGWIDERQVGPRIVLKYKTDTFHPRFIISLARQIVTVSPPPYTGHRRSRKVIFISRILLFVSCSKRIFEEAHGF